MRTALRLAGIAAIIVSPLPLGGSAYAPAATSPNVPERCYSHTTYDYEVDAAGFPSAQTALEEHLRIAQSNYQDLHHRAPQLTDDPFLPGFLGHAQGEVTGFTALLEKARSTSHSASYASLRAMDQDGQLIAEVTFNRTNGSSHGGFLIGEATMPDNTRDPARHCSPQDAVSPSATS